MDCEVGQGSAFGYEAERQEEVREPRGAPAARGTGAQDQARICGLVGIEADGATIGDIAYAGSV